MHRTQIYLEETQYDELRARARRRGTSMAALIREILARYLAGSSPGQDALDQVLGIGRGDGSAVAEEYEEYLYGESS